MSKVGRIRVRLHLAMSAGAVLSRWKLGAIVVFGCIGSLALSGQAAARPFEAAFSVRTSNGFRISVAGWHDSVRILVTQGAVRIGEHVIATEYSGRGRASHAGIEADLGGLGSISMRFRPSAKGEVRASPKNCSPPKVYRQPGTFSGSFHFVGEASYTVFEATEVKGSIGSPQDLICGTFLPARKDRPPRLPYLVARTSNYYLADGFLAFGARRTVEGPHRVEFAAELRERIEGHSVRRFVTEASTDSNFVVGSHLDRATVAPPAPFSGDATFQHRSGADPGSWSGSLTVSFLGKSNMPLTGPNFRFVALDRSSF